MDILSRIRLASRTCLAPAEMSVASDTLRTPRHGAGPLLARRALATALLMFVAAGAATAAPEIPYRPEAFAAAQAAGKPILIDIYAPWCPTCASQRPVIKQLGVDRAFRDLVILVVDFDNQKDVVRALRARSQSTLIVFNGKEERGRSVGETDPAAIRALAERAMAK